MRGTVTEAFTCINICPVKTNRMKLLYKKNEQKALLEAYKDSCPIFYILLSKITNR